MGLHIGTCPNLLKCNNVSCFGLTGWLVVPMNLAPQCWIVWPVSVLGNFFTMKHCNAYKEIGCECVPDIQMQHYPNTSGHQLPCTHMVRLLIGMSVHGRQISESIGQSHMNKSCCWRTWITSDHLNIRLLVTTSTLTKIYNWMKKTELLVLSCGGLPYTFSHATVQEERNFLEQSRNYDEALNPKKVGFWWGTEVCTPVTLSSVWCNGCPVGSFQL